MKIILLIEDNKEIRETTSEILEMASYKVITAENGKAGMELAKKELPDLIICDVMMPELDGFGVLHILSKNSSTASIPFIFLTAKAEKEDIRKGMNLGADDYLTKPFDELELLDAVEMRLRKSQLAKDANNGKTEEVPLRKGRGLGELDEFLNDESNRKIIPKKHSLFLKGGYPDFLYYIVKGKIKTFKKDVKENEFITGLYKEGDFVGYTDLLEDSRYREDAFALEDSEVCKIKKDDFFAMISSNHDIASRFIKLLTGNVVEREERLLKLAYNSVKKRVAEALLMLKDKYEMDSSGQFTMAISRDDLAGLVGASKENVIRALSDFKGEGLIEINSKHITMLNADKLGKIRN